jgi:putative DNA primase/helicase
MLPNAIQAPETGDIVTILTAGTGLALAKTYTGPGLALKQYDDARNFSTQEVEVDGIRDLFGVLQRLEGKTRSGIIRGRFIGESAALAFIQPEKPGQWRRLSALFPDTGRRWFCCDFDKVEAPGWKSNPVEAVEKIIAARLPVEFVGVTFAYRFTASAGFSDEIVSVHVWFWLDVAIPSDLWRGWIKNKNIATDTATAKAVQIHYTAAPVFKDGAVDPMAAAGLTRLGLVEGWAGDEVVGFRISPEDALNGGRPADAPPGVGIVQVDPTTKPGWIGAFCKAYTFDEALPEFLSEVFEYEHADDARRLNYIASTSGAKGGAFVSDDRMYVVNTHNGDPCNGRSTNMFDLVRCHRFGYLDEDAPADTPINKMPSTVAMGEFCATLPGVSSELVKARAENAAERFGEAPAEVGKGEAPTKAPEANSAPDDWSVGLDVTKNGTIIANLANSFTILTKSPAFAGVFGMNEMTGQPAILKALPWRKRRTTSVAGDQWTDADDAFARRHLEAIFEAPVAMSTVVDALRMAADVNRFHPVREYLDGLTWDGVARLDEWLIKVLRLDAATLTRARRRYLAAVGRKFFAAAVARVRVPGIKFDHMLVFHGDQGLGKSRLARVLAVREDFFGENPPPLSQGKELLEWLRGLWVAEFGELAGLSNREVEHVRTFLATSSDRYRDPYGRRTLNQPRQCVFIGNANEVGFLKDPEGNRRFWVVHAPGELDTEWVRLNIDQLYAEAEVAFALGEPLYLEDDEVRVESEAVQGEYLNDSSGYTGQIEEFLATPVPANYLDYAVGEFNPDGETAARVLREVVSVREIWVDCLGGPREKIPPTEHAAILRAIRKTKGIERNSFMRRQGRRFGLQRCYKISDAKH